MRYEAACSGVFLKRAGAFCVSFASNSAFSFITASAVSPSLTTASFIEDLKTGPKELRSTVLSEAEEATIVAF